MNLVNHRGFQAGKAEVVFRPVHSGPGEREGAVSALLRDPVQMNPAGIGHPHSPGRLVKGLSRSIVPGSANNPHFSVIRHLYNVAVAAGHHQTKKGRL